MKILTGENLGSPEYRLGDWTGRLVGARNKIAPWVEVKYGSQRFETSVLEGQSSDQVRFEEAFAFPYRSDFSRKKQCVKFRMFDNRGAVQASLRGDPMIWEATLQFSPSFV